MSYGIQSWIGGFVRGGMVSAALDIMPDSLAYPFGQEPESQGLCSPDGSSILLIGKQMDFWKLQRLERVGEDCVPGLFGIPFSLIVLSYQIAEFYAFVQEPRRGQACPANNLAAFPLQDGPEAEVIECIGVDDICAHV